jgi:hypothetical protein
VAVINVSRGGLLLESDVRLRPGSGICLNVVVDGETQRVDGRVLHVDARIVANRVMYRAGVAFDQELKAFDSPADEGERPDGPVPLPPIDTTARPAGSPDFEAEAARLTGERDAERRQREEQAQTIAALREALRSGEQLRQEILDTHAAERGRWEREQHDLVERVRESEEQASAMMQDMKAARDSSRKAAKEHAVVVADLEALVREREQQLTALRAEQAALLESVTRRLEEYEARDTATQAHHGRLSGQLAATEAWCADQQDLLYRVRQQMTAMFALLEGQDAARPLALPEGAPRPRLLLPRPATIHVLPAPAHRGPSLAERTGS